MGISDPVVFPIHTAFIRLAMELSPASRIAWLGSPGPYPVSAAFPKTHHSFADIEPRFGDHVTIVPFDLNMTGWGRFFAEGRLVHDALTLLRCSYFHRDPPALLKELSDFLEAGGKWVVLEHTQKPQAFEGDVTPIDEDMVERTFDVAHSEVHRNLRGERFRLFLLRKRA
jgi:hypothetical protein